MPEERHAEHDITSERSEPPPDSQDRRAESFYIIRQHVGWLKQYVSGMSPENWRDMQLRCERQLEELESDLSRAQAERDKAIEACARECERLIHWQSGPALRLAAKAIRALRSLTPEASYG